eukprot:5759902-Prymnesium_polylepis.1
MPLILERREHPGTFLGPMAYDAPCGGIGRYACPAVRTRPRVAPPCLCCASPTRAPSACHVPSA